MKTSDAAKSLNIHPLNLLLRLQSLVGSPEECWPIVEEGFIETLKHLDQKAAFPKERVERQQHGGKEEETKRAPASMELSRSAAKVIEKLWRKSYWGKKEISWDTMRNHHCKGIENLEEAVEELVQIGYLTRVPDGDAYSLNAAHKTAIEETARKSIAATTHS